MYLKLSIIFLSFHCLIAKNQDFLLFSGSSNKKLVEAVANELGVKSAAVDIGKFNDGETRIKILENIRNREVFIIQSSCPSLHQSVNDNLMELFLLIRTMKRSSAKKITAVIPYYGYARQDRKTDARVPISASDIAILLEAAGVDRVISIDLHCGQIQGFFHNVPVDNLYASTIFVPHFTKKNLKNLVVISPDAGGVDRAKKFMEKLTKQGLKSKLAIMIKQRKEAGKIDQISLVGSVKDSDVIIVDDMCDTAGTLVKAAKLLKDKGAKRIYAAITHPVFSNPALDRIEKSVIDEMVISDTICIRTNNCPKNLTQISVAPLIAEAIKQIYKGESISYLF